MENFDRKKHWEEIYRTRALDEVSWYQPLPETTLRFLEEYRIPATARIIDVGGGDSLLVDHLLRLGYQDVTVLDISESALDRAKKRLGGQAEKVKWITADIASFEGTEKYDFWHDRAAFHFLSQDKEIDNYIRSAFESLNTAGFLLIGTFSEKGPDKCSGIAIRQYSGSSLAERFADLFEMVNYDYVDHVTPSGAVQNYVFCVFKKKANL